jgi:hypothetical protein
MAVMAAMGIVAPGKSDIDRFNNCNPGARFRTRPEGR